MVAQEERKQIRNRSSIFDSCATFSFSTKTFRTGFLGNFFILFVFLPAENFFLLETKRRDFSPCRIVNVRQLHTTS